MESMKKNTDWIYFILLLVWLFLFGIQDAVQDKIKLFQYVDEAFCLLIFPVFLLRWYQKKIFTKVSRELIWFLGLFAVFWGSGWVGVFRYHYQPLGNVLKDAYVNLKFFLAIVTSYLVFKKVEDFSQIEKWLWYAVNVATATLFVLCICDLIFGWFYTETRYGLPAIKLFYDSYTALVAVCCLLCAIYLRLYEYYQKKILIPLALLFFIMLNTKRVKALGAMVCLFLIYIYVFQQGKKVNRKILIISTISIGIAAFSIGWQLIYYYYELGHESARLILTIAAPYITKDYLPFGTGWATFASAFSVEPYSPIYTMYGMNVVWGISPEYHPFVSDTFWPMILVQSGVIGLLAYIGVIMLLLRKIWSLRKGYPAMFASSLFSMAYLLLSSSSESAFVNPLAVPFAYFIGFLFAEHSHTVHRMEKTA